MLTLAVTNLAVRSFRNLDRVDVSFCPGLNVLSGENGQGKTNILEAIYVVATSKSFRSKKSSDLISYGQSVANAKFSILEGGGAREQSLGIVRGSLRVLCDGNKPQTLAAYALLSPVVVFHPGEVVLSMGGGAERRRLLDRVALFISPASSVDRGRYARALRERQRALEVRGPLARDIPEWEELLVQYGLAITTGRAEAARRLAVSAKWAFDRMARPLGVFGVEYRPGSPESVDAFREALSFGRERDAWRGGPLVGPHKDDLSLTLDGLPVKGRASQGQHRSVVLALKSAELEVISLARGVRPLLLLDDVSSELDPFRTKALFSYLQDHVGQVFLTTTRPELIELSSKASESRRDFVVRSGRIFPRGDPSVSADGRSA